MSWDLTPEGPERLIWSIPSRLAEAVFMKAWPLAGIFVWADKF